jgi:hypothetical protein
MLGVLERKEWEERIKMCKNALEFTKESVQRLSEILG